jgi:hypothetical protein
MKNLMLTAAFALLSSFLFAQCQDTNIPNRPVPGLISTVQNFYGNETIGQISDFQLKPFSKLPGHHVILKFDLAYTFFPGRYDSLLITASSDCGKTWETLLYSGGQELSTTEPTSDYFIPNRSEWQSYEFDLYRFSGPILVRFRFINGNGNNLYLDNLGYQYGLSATDTPTEIKSSLKPNPVKDSGVLQLNQPVNNGTMMIMDTNGRARQRLENLDGNEIQIEASQLNPGIYYYLLQEEGQTLSYGQFAVLK